MERDTSLDSQINSSFGLEENKQNLDIRTKRDLKDHLMKHSNFKKEETEVQRDHMLCTMSTRYVMAGLGSEFRYPNTWSNKMFYYIMLPIRIVQALILLLISFNIQVEKMRAVPMFHFSIRQVYLQVDLQCCSYSGKSSNNSRLGCLSRCLAQCLLSILPSDSLAFGQVFAIALYFRKRRGRGNKEIKIKRISAALWEDRPGVRVWVICRVQLAVLAALL